MHSAALTSAASLPTAAADAAPVPLGAELAVAGGEVIAFPTGRYAIPVEDMMDFTSLAVAEQERIKLILSFVARMEAEGVVCASKNLAFQLRHLPGYSESNLKALYYKWKAGGWMALRRSYTNGHGGLSREFVQYFRALTEQNSRSMRQAMGVLRRAWFAGESIPGYGTWREWFATEYPERDLPAICPRTPKGWGESNLYTLQPTKAQRALKTRGFAEAKKHLLSIIRDPSKLLPLQLVVIDDFEIDQLCVVRGHRQLCKMVGVAAMDVATRHILAVVLKPRLEDDAGKQQAITRAEVRLLLFQVLREHGIPAHGMTILCEKAAAAVTAELETTFQNLFGGRVAITRTTTLDSSVLSGGFRETGGKPWLKGWIESFFNLLHNVAAGLAQGQKGASYQLKPADLAEKQRITQRLLGSGPRDAQLSEDQVSRLRLPFSSPEELCDLYLKIFRWIEERTDHELLGFDQVQEWRAHESEAPRPFGELATLTVAEQTRVEILPPRMESPRERWAKLYPAVKRTAIGDHVLMLLLLTPKKATRKGYKVTFAHNGMGYTWVLPPKGDLVETLRDGEDCLCYFDPANAGSAYLARLDGRALGEVKRWGSVDITDAAACTEAERDLARLYAEVRQTVAERPLHQAENARLLEDREVNAAILAEAGKPREMGLTATITRAVPTGPAVTAAGEDLARQTMGARDAERASIAAAKAVQRATQRAAATLDESDREAFLAPAPAAPDEPTAEAAEERESLADYL